MSKNLRLIILSFLLAIVVWSLITLSYEYTTEIEFDLSIVSAGRELGLAAGEAGKVTIKCRSTGWKLIRLKYTDGNEYQVISEKNFEKDSVLLQKYLSQNQWLSANAQILEFMPEKIKVTAEQIRKKNIVVRERGNFIFKNGYGIAGAPKITPDTIEVTGPLSLLSKLEFVETEGTLQEQIDGKTELLRKIRFPQGVESRTREVLVSLDVQQIVDKEFSGISITVSGVPADRTVLLNPATVNVSVRGGIDFISQMRAEDLRIDYPYASLVQDTVGVFAPSVKTERPVEILMTNPKYIRFIIKKYSDVNKF